MIAARLNSHSHTIGFLFHAFKNGVSQIYGANFLLDAGWPQRFDSSAAKQLTSSTGDAWNAALDFDGSGNYMTSWYERIPGTTVQYVTKTGSLSGDLSSISGAACYSCTPSDVAVYTAGGLGEYQDIWYASSAGAWVLGTIGTHTVGASSQGDAVTYNSVP
jgi:hypothetical protein